MIEVQKPNGNALHRHAMFGRFTNIDDRPDSFTTFYEKTQKTYQEECYNFLTKPEYFGSALICIVFDKSTRVLYWGLQFHSDSEKKHKKALIFALKYLDQGYIFWILVSKSWNFLLVIVGDILCQRSQPYRMTYGQSDNQIFSICMKFCSPFHGLSKSAKIILLVILLRLISDIISGLEVLASCGSLSYVCICCVFV